MVMTTLPPNRGGRVGNERLYASHIGAVSKLALRAATSGCDNISGNVYEGPSGEHREDEAMIDLFLKYASDPAVGPELEAAIADLTGTAGQGNADLVETAELAVRAAAPGEAFSFGADGF